MPLKPSHWFIAALCWSVFAVAPAVAEELPDYQARPGVAGMLNSVGSDTMAVLMAQWQNEFQNYYPHVTIQLQAVGSASVPPALNNGATSLGTMSRKMTSGELAKFEDQHGYPPLQLRVAIDAPGVYVHKDNPLHQITLQQLDAIFSATRQCGAAEAISHWGQLGVGGELAQRPIQLYGRNAVSGTYGFFKTKALCGGDFHPHVNEQPGSSGVVQSVASTRNGIGYAGIGYKTSGVKALAIASKEGKPAVAATPDNALSGQYPLARFLYIYVNKAPGKALPPLEQAFLEMIFAKPGQRIIAEVGYVPLTATLVRQELDKIRQ